MCEAYLVLGEITSELTISLVEIVSLAIPEEIEKLLLGILIDYLVNIIIDIDLGSRVHYCLYLIDKLAELKPLGMGNLLKGYLPVYQSDDIELRRILVRYAPHTQILGPLYLILLHMPLYELYEVGSITFCLPYAYSGNVLQLFYRYRIGRGHGLK